MSCAAWTTAGRRAEEGRIAGPTARASAPRWRDSAGESSPDGDGLGSPQAVQVVGNAKMESSACIRQMALRQKFFLNPVQTVLAEEHLIADEEGRGAERASGDGCFRVLFEPVLDFRRLDQGPASGGDIGSWPRGSSRSPVVFGLR